MNTLNVKEELNRVKKSIPEKVAYVKRERAELSKFHNEQKEVKLENNSSSEWESVLNMFVREEELKLQKVLSNLMKYKSFLENRAKEGIKKIDMVVRTYMLKT